MIYPDFPNNILFWKAFKEWYRRASNIPATVNTPPMIAQILVAR